MAKRDARVSQYIQKCAPFARPILRHLRSGIHAGAPGLVESIKWGMPAFLYEGRIVCGIAGFKAHCALWFWKSKAVVGKKPASGMGHFGRITSVKDLPSPSALKSYVRKAVKLSEQGR